MTTDNDWLTQNHQQRTAAGPSAVNAAEMQSLQLEAARREIDARAHAREAAARKAEDAAFECLDYGYEKDTTIGDAAEYADYAHRLLECAALLRK